MARARSGTDVPSWITHPVRLRLVQALLPDRRLTTRQLLDLLQDVPEASLYRHISRLVDDQTLVVVEERRVRGSVERTLALSSSVAGLGPAETARLSRQERRHMFMTFVAGLIAQFDEGGQAAEEAQPYTGFRVRALNLTPEEAAEFTHELAVMLARWMELPAEPRRHRFLLSTLLTAHAAGVEADADAAGRGTGGTAPASRTGPFEEDDEVERTTFRRQS